MTEILSEKESTDLRELFTETFADTNSFEFDKGIRQKTCFSDGEFYSACLWDFFKNLNCQSEVRIFRVKNEKYPKFTLTKRYGIYRYFKIFRA